MSSLIGFIDLPKDRFRAHAAFTDVMALTKVRDLKSKRVCPPAYPFDLRLVLRRFAGS